MHELTPTSPTTDTMSSRELAEMYGKPHNDTLKKIRKLEKAYIQVFGDQGNFSQISYTDPGGREYPEILLNKSQALFVASRFDAVLHAKVQKRWEELEAERQDPMRALNDPAAMRGLLLTYTEKVLALEEEKKELQPKADGFDRIAKSDGLTCITDTAKSLQMRPKDLFNWLSENKWIYRRAGGKGWLAYQNRIQQGVLSHKVTTVNTSDGRDKIIESVKVTPKGLARIAGLVGMEVAA